MPTSRASLKLDTGFNIKGLHKMIPELAYLFRTDLPTDNGKHPKVVYNRKFTI